MEEGFWAPESLVTYSDNLSVRKLVRLLERAGTGSSCHFLFEVQGDVAKFLLDVPDDFPLSGGGERITSLCQDLHEVVSQITSSKVKTDDGVREGIT